MADRHFFWRGYRQNKPDKGFGFFVCPLILGMLQQCVHCTESSDRTPNKSFEPLSASQRKSAMDTQTHTQTKCLTFTSCILFLKGLPPKQAWRLLGALSAPIGCLRLGLRGGGQTKLQIGCVAANCCRKNLGEATKKRMVAGPSPSELWRPLIRPNHGFKFEVLDVVVVPRALWGTLFQSYNEKT
jgi:hypothetical protein